jgi:drug/metabolite transporter (DMT)-like permease
LNIEQPSPRRARVYVLAAAFLWSTSGAGFKSANLDGWQVAGGRALFAALAMAVFMPEARRGALRAGRAVVAVGIAYAATTVLYAWANKLTTAANSIFLQDAAPLWVLLLGPLILREQPTRAELLLSPLYLAGIGLFFVDRLEPGQTTGNLVAIASGVAFAFLIIGLRFLRGGGADAAVLIGNVAGVIVCAPQALRGAAPGARDVAILAYLGIFQLGLAYWFFNRGLRGVSALEGSLLALLEPILNPIWTFLVAGERPGPWAIAGGCVILGATVLRLVTAPSKA